MMQLVHLHGLHYYNSRLFRTWKRCRHPKQECKGDTLNPAVVEKSACAVYIESPFGEQHACTCCDRNYITVDDVCTLLPEEKAKEAFAVFDTTCNGKVSQSEVHDAVLQIFTCAST